MRPAMIVSRSGQTILFWKASIYVVSIFRNLVRVALKNDMRHWNQEYSDRTRDQQKTELPASRRLICAAPWANTSGAEPSTKTIEVIVTARNRIRAPSRASSTMAMPYS